MQSDGVASSTHQGLDFRIWILCGHFWLVTGPVCRGDWLEGMVDQNTVKAWLIELSGTEVVALAVVW